MTKEEIFEYESKRLEYVVKLINEKLADAKQRFDEQEHFIIGFKEGQRGTQFTRQSLMSFYATEIYDLNSILSSPYFGRFEFKENNENEIQIIYIGKKIIIDKDGKIISYDWRSPICSMYYDFNIGDANYKQNDEKHSGTILGKRQFIIKDSILKEIDEQDTLSDDSLLMRYLSENSDSRLKSIIATIQREQNVIIRNPLRSNYIVQGAAGSGKTTVALHRIAYLIYNEAKNISDTQFMILGPNKYFLNYVSSLLPDLDIKNVSQTTFEQIVMSNIGTKIKLLNQNSVLQDILSGKIDRKIIEYKNSLEFLKTLRKFTYLYIISHLQEDITYNGITLCSKEHMINVLNFNADKSNNYSKKINNFIKYLIKKVKDNAEDLGHEIWLKYRDEFKSLPKDSPRRKEILDYTDMINAELKKGCSNIIKDFFKFIKISPFELYKSFIESLGKLDIDYNCIEDLQLYTLANISNKQISSDDLAPLLYLGYLINGVDSYREYEHLVIDEAQDLSIAQYYVLKLLFPNCYFDLFGDMNQSIYDYQSVKSWDLLNLTLFESKASVLELNKSYRTTVEISNAANLILDFSHSTKADCIARQGEIVVTNKIEKGNILEIINQIKTLTDKGYESIAIICKDDSETANIYSKLHKFGLTVHHISEKDDKFEGGLCVIPSYLSKGLEFDAVIINDASSLIYGTDSIDLKLLYVAMTRSMHELIINYSGNISKALEPLLEQRGKDTKLSRIK